MRWYTSTICKTESRIAAGTGHTTNKTFRDAAQARDLEISYDKRIGWSVTEPSDVLVEFIIEQGWEDVHMSRTEGFSARGIGTPGKSGAGTGGPQNGGGRPSSTRKLVVPNADSPSGLPGMSTSSAEIAWRDGNS